MSGGQHNRPTDAFRKGLAIVVRAAPEAVWAALSGFYETATRSERERLGRYISASTPFASDISRTGPGVLFAAPMARMLAWVEQDPDGRVGFIVSFFQILEQVEEVWRWHPALRALADRYGDRAAFRTALRSRILPSSCGGSLSEHLDSFRTPLATWDGETRFGRWAAVMLAEIDRWLEDEAERAEP